MEFIALVLMTSDKNLEVDGSMDRWSFPPRGFGP